MSSSSVGIALLHILQNTVEPFENPINFFSQHVASNVAANLGAMADVHKLFLLQEDEMF